MGEKREERLMKKVKGEVDRNMTEVMVGGEKNGEERQGKTEIEAKVRGERRRRKKEKDEDS